MTTPSHVVHERWSVRHDQTIFIDKNTLKVSLDICSENISLVDVMYTVFICVHCMCNKMYVDDVGSSI
jgi:hypothetical protein